MNSDKKKEYYVPLCAMFISIGLWYRDRFLNIRGYRTHFGRGLAILSLFVVSVAFLAGVIWVILQWNWIGWGILCVWAFYELCMGIGHLWKKEPPKDSYHHD